jgi:hypothetical protein
MRKLIMQLELTLDGFYAGPNEEFDWFKLDLDQKTASRVFGFVNCPCLEESRTSPVPGFR